MGGLGVFDFLPISFVFNSFERREMCFMYSREYLKSAEGHLVCEKKNKGIDELFLGALIENLNKEFASQFQVLVHHLREVKAAGTWRN